MESGPWTKVITALGVGLLVIQLFLLAGSIFLLHGVGRIQCGPDSAGVSSFAQLAVESIGPEAVVLVTTGWLLWRGYRRLTPWGAAVLLVSGVVGCVVDTAAAGFLALVALSC